MIERRHDAGPIAPSGSPALDRGGPLRSVIHGVPIGLALWAVLAVIAEHLV